MWPVPRRHCFLAARSSRSTGTPSSGYESRVAKNPDSSRVPSAVGSLPVVGGLVKNAEAQAKWMQEIVDQNARLVAQFPATMKSFNDSLERFNQTIGRLDRLVTQLERTSKSLTGPMERIVAAFDPKSLRDLPEALDSLRQSLVSEALPALRATTETQHQVDRLQASVERVITLVSELPGAGTLRRLVTGRTDDSGPNRTAAGGDPAK